jgi:VPDSG-CTERM motif
MKISRLHTPLLFATVLLLAGTKLLAVPSNPTLTFQENGQGKVELPNGAVIPLPGALASDPGPGGLSSALTFTAHPAEELLVVGDVLLFDSSGKVSDVLRFNPDPSPGAPRLTSPILFYSSDSAGLLADTGLPTAFYTNTATISENHSGFTIYTPVAGQPGFEPATGALPITYQILSIPDAGSSVSLLAMALCGIGLLRRKTV